jgi:hypothetical protein
MPMRGPPDKDRGRPGGNGLEVQQITATNGPTIIADARGRVRAQAEQRWAARQLHHGGCNLVTYYRRPRGLPYCRVVEGWAA